MRTPLSKVRGLGSAKSGVHHWIMQRITAVALVPLGLWFVWSLSCLAGADHATVSAWVAGICNATLLIVFIAALFYHSQLGLQTVIEDYVHQPALKLMTLLGCLFANILLAVAGILSVLRIALGS